MILRFLSFVTDFFVPRRVYEDFGRLFFPGFSISQDESKCVELGSILRSLSNRDVPDPHHDPESVDIGSSGEKCNKSSTIFHCHQLS